MKRMVLTLLTLVLASLAATAYAGGIEGTWSATADTAKGPQHYRYEFTRDGRGMHGTVHSAHGDSNLQNVEMRDDVITFVEYVAIGDSVVCATYVGKILPDDSLVLYRKIEDVSLMSMIARREMKP